jgi:hypothetical protein
MLAAGVAAICIAGCSTPSRMGPDRLAALGVSEGASYWTAQQGLAREGYRCYVSGAQRENVDCTKTEGLFPTCLLRIEFTVDEQNRIERVQAADPACMGTP